MDLPMKIYQAISMSLRAHKPTTYKHQWKTRFHHHVSHTSFLSMTSQIMSDHQDKGQLTQRENMCHGWWFILVQFWNKIIFSQKSGNPSVVMMHSYYAIEFCWYHCFQECSCHQKIFPHISLQQASKHSWQCVYSSRINQAMIILTGFFCDVFGCICQKNDQVFNMYWMFINKASLKEKKRKEKKRKEKKRKEKINNEREWLDLEVVLPSL